MAKQQTVPASGIKAVITPYAGELDNSGNIVNGYRLLNNPTALTLEPSVEDDSIIGRMIENEGQNLDALKEFGDFTFGITMNRMDAFNLGFHVAGDRSEIDVASASGAVIAVDLKADSLWVTGFRNLTAATIGALVSGTDFDIFDAAGGVLQIYDTAAVVTAEGLAVAGTVDHDAYTGDRVSLIQNTTKKIKLWGQGKDRVSGRRFAIQLNQVSVSADGAIDFMNDDRAQVQLSGLIETPTGGSPGFIDFYA